MVPPRRTPFVTNTSRRIMPLRHSQQGGRCTHVNMGGRGRRAAHPLPARKEEKKTMSGHNIFRVDNRDSGSIGDLSELPIRCANVVVTSMKSGEFR